ncbi:hypothetical protein [Streptomyces sp. NPDC088801]|uniref:hypothetical protein n=1 Tax=Streptomyces sp. NPDC088801 TaxID=3365903 RepID=UPI0037FC2DA7
MAAAVLTTPPVWRLIFFVGWLAFLVVFAVLGTGVTAHLAPDIRRRLFTLRNAASAALYLGLTVVAGGVLAVDRTGGMFLLALVAITNYFLTGRGNEELIPLARLHFRITKRVAFRITAIVSAAMALILFLSLIRPEPDQQNANFSFAMGASFAAGAASLKVHSRARKLCTQINAQARSLIQALDSLAAATADQVSSDMNDARHEWHQLSQLLENRIETGLPLHGTALLPASNRRRLEGMVNMALVDTPRGTLFVSQARAELQLLAQVCAQRIDTTL